jgi:hypothetical protein
MLNTKKTENMTLGTYINKRSGKEWILNAIVDGECIMYTNSGRYTSRMLPVETFQRCYTKTNKTRTK